MNRALPEDLRWINVFQFNNNWKECCNYLKRVIPDIGFSQLKEKRINEEKKSEDIFHLQTHFKNKSSNKRRRFSRRKNGRYFLCGKYGHFVNNCLKNKRNKYDKQIKNYKNNKNNKKSFRKFNKNNTSDKQFIQLMKIITKKISQEIIFRITH